jgi:RNA polymerase sigma-70 factor (ECF subfamily)
MRNSGTQAMKQSTPRWRDWLSEHGPRMLLFARQQTRRQEDAEDILQEALVKLAKKVEEGTFLGGQEAWMPFLYTQIRREAIDLGRRNDRRKRREETVVEDENLRSGGEDAWFESAGYDEERRLLLEVALKELPKKFSEVIVMKIWGGRTFAEIGEILDISMNTAASRYRYGIEALRKHLSSARIRGDL